MEKPVKKLPAKLRLDKYSTVQILGYIDIAHASMDELMERGRDMFHWQYLKFIKPEDNRPNLDKMQGTLNQYADVHNQLVKEVGNRFKRDLKLDKAPIQITTMIEQIKDKYPAFNKYSSQQLANLVQEKTAKDRAETAEKQREEEEAKKSLKAGEVPKKEKPKKEKPKMKTVKK